MIRNRFGVAASVLLLLVAFLGGCAGGGNALNPQFQPQVTNQTDNFQFQTTGITNIAQTLTYSWQDSGTAASVNQACSILGGTATLTILDANGTQVYSASLANNGTFPTTSGVSGAWTIKVILKGVSGTLNFRVQKA